MKKAVVRIFSSLTLVVAATVLGCASPPSRFYTLTAAAQPDGAPPAPYAVVVDGVSVPATVDRPQLVVQKGPNRVAIDEFNRWAAPLGSSIARAVAENLVVVLGTPRVATGPLSASFDPAYHVAIDIQRFESAPGEASTLDAVWVVRGVTATPVSGRSSQREPVAGDGYEAIAAAHSRAIGKLSREIAAAIRAEAAR